MLNAPRNRRDILKLMAAGGAMVFLPSMLTACSDDDDDNGGGITNPGSGATVTIDFAKGDTAILQFAYALEQLEADFYTRVVNAFGASGLSTAERAILTDIKNHEVLHREFFKAILGTTNGFTLSTTYPNINFNDRMSVLNTAKLLEDTGVKAYNGAAQYIMDANNLLAAGKIVSVEARHAAAIADLLNPNTNAFAPTTFDDVTRPATIAAAAQGFVVQKLALGNPPSSFVQGPNNNG
ncbi:MAG: ferritin-like domain-containing protein [Phycisphaerae bacterium]|nr:ferritin-like domain-containing protein [Gemmatimonadaceae bacterium]